MTEQGDSPRPMNIYQRLNEVRKEVSYVRKDKEVKGQGYKGVTHDAVTAAARGALITHGVIVEPHQQTSSVQYVGTTQGGATIIRYAAFYEIHFVDVDNPTDRVVIEVEAHANDHGDKAPGKALSYATKYAILKMLSIESGDDEESRVEVAQKAAPISAMDLEALHEWLKTTDTTEADFLEYLNKQPNITLASLAEMRTGVFNWAMQRLQAKAKVLKQKPKEAEEAE